MKQPTLKIDQPTSFLFLTLMFSYILVNLYRITSLELVTRFPLILLTLILCALVLYKNKNFGIQIYQIKFFLPFFLMHIVYLLNADRVKLDLNNTLAILYQLFFIALIFSLSNINWSRFQIRTFSLFSYIAIFLLFSQFFLNLNILNTNSIGAFAYFLTFFPLLYIAGYTKNNFKAIRVLILLAFAFMLILSSDTRSVLICVTLGIITWLFWNLIIRNKLFFYGYFFMLLAAGFVFTVVYPYLDKYIPNIDYYNYIVFEYTGKNLFSGREILWRLMIENINQKLFFGHGSSSQLSDFMSVNLSSHNLYLQIALQVGIVGLTLFLYFFLNVWKAIWTNRQDARVKLFACYFLGIITYQLFELSLLQNHLAMSIVQWVIIGIGLSFIFNIPKEIRQTEN